MKRYVSLAGALLLGTAVVAEKPTSSGAELKLRPALKLQTHHRQHYHRDDSPYDVKNNNSFDGSPDVDYDKVKYHRAPRNDSPSFHDHTPNDVRDGSWDVSPNSGEFNGDVKKNIRHYRHHNSPNVRDGGSPYSDDGKCWDAKVKDANSDRYSRNSGDYNAKVAIRKNPHYGRHSNYSLDVRDGGSPFTDHDWDTNKVEKRIKYWNPFTPDVRDRRSSYDDYDWDMNVRDYSPDNDWDKKVKYTQIYTPRPINHPHKVHAQIYTPRPMNPHKARQGIWTNRPIWHRSQVKKNYYNDSPFSHDNEQDVKMTRRNYHSTVSNDHDWDAKVRDGSLTDGHDDWDMKVRDNSPYDDEDNDWDMKVQHITRHPHWHFKNEPPRVARNYYKDSPYSHDHSYDVKSARRNYHSTNSYYGDWDAKVREGSPDDGHDDWDMNVQHFTRRPHWHFKPNPAKVTKDYNDSSYSYDREYDVKMGRRNYHSLDSNDRDWDAKVRDGSLEDFHDDWDMKVRNHSPYGDDNDWDAKVRGHSSDWDANGHSAYDDDLYDWDTKKAQ